MCGAFCFLQRESLCLIVSVFDERVRRSWVYYVQNPSNLLFIATERSPEDDRVPLQVPERSRPQVTRAVSQCSIYGDNSGKGCPFNRLTGINRAETRQTFPAPGINRVKTSQTSPASGSSAHAAPQRPGHSAVPTAQVVQRNPKRPAAGQRTASVRFAGADNAENA